MKLFFYYSIIFASCSLSALEYTSQPCSPITPREKSSFTWQEILDKIKPEEHKYKFDGIQNLIASQVWRSHSGDLSRSWGATSGNRNSNQQNPFLTALLNLSQEISELQEKALAVTTTNYSFLTNPEKPFIIKFCDLEGKNLLHRAIQNKNTSLIGVLLKYEPNLLNDKDNNGKQPLEYIDNEDAELLVFFNNNGIGLKEISLEGSPKSYSPLLSQK